VQRGRAARKHTAQRREQAKVRHTWSVLLQELLEGQPQAWTCSAAQAVRHSSRCTGGTCAEVA
jgi:hypothetical protein